MEQIARLALASIEGLGRSRFERLLRTFGTAEAVLDQPILGLQHVHQISLAIAERILGLREQLDGIEARWNALKRFGAEVRFCDEERYPTNLKKVSDAPAVLVCHGAIGAFPPRSVAIVGTRTPSPEALEVAGRVAEIARQRGWCVVSGLARVIDAAAHRGALDVESFGDVTQDDAATVAVLGCGLESLYPPEHRLLANAIRRRGAVVTEWLSGEVRPRWLVQRNRIISGLCWGVLVVEASSTDGSLHTVRFAQKQRRHLAVWDWSGTSVDSRGTREMGQQGYPACDESRFVEWLSQLDEDPGYRPLGLLFARELDDPLIELPT